MPSPRTPNDLRQLIEQHAGLFQLRQFLRGLADWRGGVELSFGSYKAVIDAGGPGRDRLLAALSGEADRLEQVLEEAGINVTEQ